MENTEIKTENLDILIKFPEMVGKTIVLSESLKSALQGAYNQMKKEYPNSLFWFKMNHYEEQAKEGKIDLEMIAFVM